MAWTFRTIPAPMGNALPASITLDARANIHGMKMCSVDGCEAPTVGQGLCRKHYFRMQRHGSVDGGLKRVPRAGTCTVEGCENDRKAKGLCMKHYTVLFKQKNVRAAVTAVWRGMLERCYDPSCLSYKYYGGKGVNVCARWIDFDNFVADMCPRPPGYQLGRKDHTKDYGPENVTWIPRLENIRDRKNTRKVVFGCKTMSLGEACQMAEVPYLRVWKRLNRGETFYQAIR